VRQIQDRGERNLREIGRKLGVAYIMEGSVQPPRDRLRINAQLIERVRRSRLGGNLRSYRVDLFAIQSELAESDRRSAEGEAFARAEAEIEERPTQDLDAFELYLQASNHRQLS